VRDRTAALTDSDFTRGEFAARGELQKRELALPPLPTTTIGSFPQTGAIRRARSRFGRGGLTADEYTEAMRGEIRRVVELQEEIGLDVIVHGGRSATIWCSNSQSTSKVSP
jgi:5-methyltetrahydropteroyltriglutamate--homocysteine methyltransferase